MPEQYLVIFLMSIIFSISSSSIGLNYQKNKVLNLGLVGITYFGVNISSIFSKFYETSPYWGFLVGLILGGIINSALNIWYFDSMKHKVSGITLTAISVIVMGGFIMLSRGLWGFYRTQSSNPITHQILIDSDFILFNISGILIVSTSTLLFSLLFQHALQPVIVKSNDAFSKWDVIVYFLAGSMACSAGVFIPFWFIANSRWVILMPISSMFFGGVTKRINSVVGGLLIGPLYVILTRWAQSNIGVWIADYYPIPVILILLSVPFFPEGIIGRFRKIVEYKY